MSEAKFSREDVEKLDFAHIKECSGNMNVSESLTQDALTRLAQFAGWELNTGEDKVFWTAKDPFVWVKIEDIPFPKDINACLELIEAMRRDGFEWTGKTYKTKQYSSSFVKVCLEFETTAPTLPAAICAAVDKYLDSKEGK